MRPQNGNRRLPGSRSLAGLSCLAVLVLMLASAQSSAYAQGSDPVCGRFYFVPIPAPAPAPSEPVGGASSGDLFFVMGEGTGKTVTWQVHPLAMSADGNAEDVVGRHVRLWGAEVGLGRQNLDMPTLFGWQKQEIVASCGAPAARPLVDSGEWAADLTIGDGTPVTANTRFTKTWQLRNTGTSTWSTAYQVAFVSGDRMAGPAAVNLKQAVKPGATVNVSVSLTAPARTGTYTAHFQLRNAQGKAFGSKFLVQIYVPAPVSAPAGNRPAQAAVCGANNDLPPFCGCLSYVALHEFGKYDRPGRYGKVQEGDWSSAASAADQVYWNNGFTEFACKPAWRYRNDVPQAGDVMIIQGGARYFMLSGGYPRQAAVSSGHTGFVQSAVYRTRQTFPQDSSTYDGWEVLLRSANWGCYGKPTFTDNTCQNVSDVPAFFPNGDSVSFWHGIEGAKFYTIAPGTGGAKKALAPSGDPNDAAVVQALRKAGAEEQMWAVETLSEKDPLTGAPYVRIVNYQTGKCLDVANGSSNNGAAIVEWRCHNGDNQKWLKVPLYGRYVIQSKASGKVLTVPNATTAANAQIVQQNRQSASAGQQWLLEEVKPAECR